MFILVILYIQEYVFLQIVYWVSEDFQFWVSGSQNNRKCTALVPCYPHKLYSIIVERPEYM